VTVTGVNMDELDTGLRRGRGTGGAAGRIGFTAVCTALAMVAATGTPAQVGAQLINQFAVPRPG
jgi:hypothetical protein